MTSVIAELSLANEVSHCFYFVLIILWSVMKMKKIAKYYEAKYTRKILLHSWFKINSHGSHRELTNKSNMFAIKGICLLLQVLKAQKTNAESEASELKQEMNRWVANLYLFT